jgi:hypothetical protein
MNRPTSSQGDSELPRRRPSRRGLHPKATLTGFAVLARNRIVGLDRYPAPWSYFGPGGMEEAEAFCAEANRDLPGFLRPPSTVSPSGIVREPGATRRDGVEVEHWSLDSPLPSGVDTNDRVRLRLYRPQEPVATDRVVLFHHPFYQRRWMIWEWFLEDLIRQVPVAIVASPNHFERVAPGRFPGEDTVNPNPARLFRALRQWCWDHQAVVGALRESAGLNVAAEIGYSLGGFQTYLLATTGRIEVPIVSIASTNRYAHGLLRGIMGAGVVRGMRTVGLDARRLATMTRSLSLEKHVHVLHGHDVMYVRGLHDRVDPPPSLDRLERALKPTRSLSLNSGHATLLRLRTTILQEISDFLADTTGLELRP